ncbi:MAG: BTAD domain-containing putative transcriptional regulator [Chloroflexota bacterium]
MKEALVIQLLGPPQIRLDETEITFRLAKESALLYYMAATGHPHTRTDLAEFFWPDREPGLARRYLRNHLVDLRRHLGTHMMITPDKLGFDCDISSTVDIHQFHQQLPDKMQGNSQDTGQHNHHHDQQRRAVDLYRGDFLEGFYLTKTPFFNDWVDHKRDELRNEVSTLLFQLSETEITLGNRVQAYSDIERLLTLVPWHEEAHQRKMRLLYEDGQRWAALEQYATLQAVLREELDVEPSVESEQLIERIRADDDAVSGIDRQPSEPHVVEICDVAHPTTQASQPVSPTHHMTQPRLTSPAPLVPLIGHDDLLATVQGHLQSDAHRLVTLVGMGGVGKSHIALTLGQMFLREDAGGDNGGNNEGDTDRFPDGVGFVPLAGVEAIEQHPEGSRGGQVAGGQVAGGQVAGGQVAGGQVAGEQEVDAQRFLGAIIKTLQLPVSSSSDGLTQIISYLQQRRLLLILDNFEHILGAKPLLTALVQQAPSCAFLVTSRVRLQAMGETTVQIQPLPVAQVSELDTTLMTLPTGTPHQHHEQGITQGQPSTPTTLAAMLPETEDYASIKLFLDYAQRYHAQLAIGPSDLTAISKLCHLTGGLPLILSMVAAWTEHFTLPQIVRQLEKDSRLFAQTTTEQTSTYHPLVYASGNYHTLDAFFDQSWQLLSAPEQGSLSALANFVGSFDLDAAQAIVGVNMFDLKRLTDTSLLQVQQIGRYAFHPLIRDYLQEKWEAAVADDETHEQIFWERYCTYFFDIVATYVPQLNGEQASDSLANLRREQDHIHLAWRQAITHNFVHLVQSAFEQLARFYNRCHFFNETLALCQRVRQLCEQHATNPRYTSLLLAANLVSFETLVENHQFAEALTSGQPLQNQITTQIATQAMPISPDIEMRHHLAYARALRSTGAIEESVTHVTDAYHKLADQISPSIAGDYNRFLLNHAFFEGDIASMLVYAETTLDYYHQDGNLWETIFVLQMATQSPDKEKNRQRIERAMTLSRTLNHLEGEAHCHIALASLLHLSQSPQRIAHLQDAITLFQTLGDPLGVFSPMLALVAEYIRVGCYTEGHELQHFLMTQPHVREYLEGYYLISAQGAILAIHRGELEKALRMTEEMISLHDQVGPVMHPLGFLCRGFALLHNEEIAEAQTAFEIALQGVQQNGDTFGERFMRGGLAEATLAHGDLDKAKVHVEWLLPQLDQGLDKNYFAEEALIIDYFYPHWICYQVLGVMGDARADDVLQNSSMQLQSWTKGIQDVALRSAFLENVRVNQMIVQEAQRINGVIGMPVMA